MGSKLLPYMLQGGLNFEVSEVKSTHGRRMWGMGMGRYAAKNGHTKGRVSDQ